jgi:predicted metalloprotease with PDZ domain
MWRGGLSGPQSLFVHAARPLITPDASSPLVHEVVHTLMRARAGDDGDWIVEGMAEYFSLQTLVRSRTISQRRYERALALKRRRAQEADTVLVPTATGPVTAKAVMLLVALDKRIREVTAERASLDDVLVRLTKSRRPITTARLRRITEKITRRNFQTFFARIR